MRVPVQRTLSQLLRSTATHGCHSEILPPVIFEFGFRVVGFAVVVVVGWPWLPEMGFLSPQIHTSVDLGGGDGEGEGEGVGDLIVNPIVR